MTTVVVAEKPSVARDIARVLGVRGKGEGCLTGEGWCVTWALGHLVHFAEPDDYGPAWAARWSLDQLPMLPERWRLRIYPKTAEQFRLVRAMLTAADTERVICATDAGREGELIFRLIVEHTRCRKPVQRLWVSSLTDEAIREGFEHLRPGTDYDALAAAARARAQADWLVGMNLTRAYTVRNHLLCTIGRVQTPTLAMIVARDAAIDAFTKAHYYELVAHLAEGFDARWSRDGGTRIDRRAEAEGLQRQILTAIEPHRTGTVTSVDRKVRRNRPPPLYDLTTLQRDANRRFGFTASRVLELAQTLYETHKLISYPRTESRHIGEDMLPRLPAILDSLDHPLAAEAADRLAAGHRLGRAYVDKTKLTDHHAILPTARRPAANLPEPLRRVYDLVAARFVAVFLPDQQVEETRVTLDIGAATFVATGSRELEPGWKRVEPRRRPRAAGAPGPDPAAEQPPLPHLQPGQTVRVEGLDVVEKETQPPRPFDDASLLNAMKHAGREIDDDALAAVMKDSGLGTPATRAEIIEKLLRTGYVARNRKQLRATDKGKALIALVAEPLRSAELTAAWERRLKDIEHGSVGADAFYRDICNLITDMIPRVRKGPAMTPEQVAAARTASGQPADQKGRRARRRRQDRRQDAAVSKTQPAGHTALGTCPVCKRGDVVETPKAYGCSRWREGCGLTIWKTLAGHRVADSELQQLIERGRTPVIEGFRSRAGTPFQASLFLDTGGRVRFSFGRGAEDADDGGTDRLSRTATTACGASSDGEPPARAAAGAPSAGQRTAGGGSPSTEPVVCPKCSKGRLIEGRRGFGCSRWREGCDFVVPKAIDGHRLSQSELRMLIEQGEIELPDSDGVRRLRLSAQHRIELVPPR